jgi:hypothetical protein
MAPSGDALAELIIFGLSLAVRTGAALVMCSQLVDAV